MKQMSFLVLISLMSSWPYSQENAYSKVFLGMVDTFRENQDTQYGVEYQFAKSYSRYGFKSIVGLMRTRESSHYLYTGFSRTSKFSASDTGPALTFSFGPGLYFHGNGDDTDLGYPLELRTNVGLLWILADGTRIGAHFSHLSNASIEDKNPGTELVTISYELPF